MQNSVQIRCKILYFYFALLNILKVTFYLFNLPDRVVHDKFGEYKVKDLH